MSPSPTPDVTRIVRAPRPWAVSSVMVYHGRCEADPAHVLVMLGNGATEGDLVRGSSGRHQPGLLSVIDPGHSFHTP